MATIIEMENYKRKYSPKEKFIGWLFDKAYENEELAKELRDTAHLYLELQTASNGVKKQVKYCFRTVSTCAKAKKAIHKYKRYAKLHDSLI